MKRITALLLCLCLTAGMFAGCGADEKAYVPTGKGLADSSGQDAHTATRPGEIEQELTLAYYPDRSLNPLQCTDYTNRAIFPLIYQSLFVVDKDLRAHPMLCKNYSVSSDMTVYTLYLQNATFSDGTVLTANDVIATLNYARESDLYFGRFSHVINVSENFDGGVRIETDTPYENFFVLLDIPILKADELEAEKPVGTGPYQLVTSPVSGSRLLRRKSWWCDPEMAVTASAINLVAGENPAKIRDEFEFEDVGLVCADPGSDSYADYRCDYELWDVESGMFLYLGFNTVESKVFSDKKVRAAVTHAINREQITDQYYKGFGHAAYLPASPQFPYYSEGLADRYGFDPDQLSEAVIGAGLQGSTIRMLVNSGDSRRLRVAEDIKKMLEQCALEVEILQYNDYYRYVLEGRTYRDPETDEDMYYDLYLGQTKLSPNMDLSPFFRDYGLLDAGGLSDPGTYSLCLDALANSGNYYNLHERVMEEGFICPILFHNYAVYATRGLLTGLDPARDNVFYYDLGTTMEESQVQVAEQPDEEE